MKEVEEEKKGGKKKNSYLEGKGMKKPIIMKNVVEK
jgi:hypothetical protein